MNCFFYFVTFSNSCRVVLKQRVKLWEKSLVRIQQGSYCPGFTVWVCRLVLGQQSGFSWSAYPKCSLAWRIMDASFCLPREIHQNREHLCWASKALTSICARLPWLYSWILWLRVICLVRADVLGTHWCHRVSQSLPFLCISQHHSELSSCRLPPVAFSSFNVHIVFFNTPSSVANKAVTTRWWIHAQMCEWILPSTRVLFPLLLRRQKQNSYV